MSEVSKFDLCLLTRNGQSIDGNWTVFWRKLDGLLTETGLLLTEPDWSIYGNRTVYWRKLDDLFTETGCCQKLDDLLTEIVLSIDGNWTVYWWKECSLFMERVHQIFFILVAWKWDFCRVLKPTVSGTPSILHLIFCCLVRRKCDFYRLMKTRAQKYLNSCEQIFPNLAAWKRGSQDSGKIEFTGPYWRKLTRSNKSTNKQWFHESAEIAFSFYQ